jgi:poly(A) polymerase Pap1
MWVKLTTTYIAWDIRPKKPIKKMKGNYKVQNLII